jgi:hypothetical protein
MLSIAIHAPRSDEWSSGKANEANDKTAKMPKGSAFGQASSFTPQRRAAGIGDGANCAESLYYYVDIG